MADNGANLRRGRRRDRVAAGLIADHNRRGVNVFRGAAMDRAGVLTSPAYLAMTPVGRRVLAKIEAEAERSGGGAVTLPRSSFGGSKGSISFGIKQCERLGFISIGIGVRRANAFSLLDDWRAVDAVEAKRLVQLAKLPKPPQVAAPKPVKPSKPAPTPKPVTVARPAPQRQVTLPRLSFMDNGR